MIKTAAFFEVVALYRGWKYAAPAHYPEQLPGVGVRQHPPGPSQTVCNPFVEGVVVLAAKRSGARFPWNLGLHEQAMIVDPVRDRFGPVDALVAAELAEKVDPHDLPPKFSVVQGWYLNELGEERGHTSFVIDVDPSDGQVLELEANLPEGVRWRGVGAIGTCQETVELPTPPLWYRRPKVRTWGGILAHYSEGVEVAALRMGD